MEYSPPPLFKQGASARVKMMVFAGISIALLLVDSRMHALTAVRQAVGTVLYPVQMAALVPRDVALGVGNYFSSLSSLEKQVRDLKHEQIASAQIMAGLGHDLMTNAELRRAAKADLERRRGDYRYVSPLPPEQRQPPGIPERLLKTGEDEVVSPMRTMSGG